MRLIFSIKGFSNGVAYLRDMDGFGRYIFGASMTYIIRATTPEQAKDEIVKWLNGMAAYHRIDASKCSRVSTFKQRAFEAAAYEAAAKFIDKIVIEGEV